jgi:nitrite reductase/ring-hydroxylating ferredoxin subunit
LSDRIEVAERDSFDAGERRIVETDRGFSVGVFNVDGEYRAILNRCIHQGGPLCEGPIEREIAAEKTDAGDWTEEFYLDSHVVKCPWHGWEYSLETGEVVGTEDTAVPTFDVTVENGTVYLEL